MMVALTCPECKRQQVFSGRGRCRCGAYLIHHFNRRMCLPDGRVYAWAEEKWERVNTPAELAESLNR